MATHSPRTSSRIVISLLFVTLQTMLRAPFLFMKPLLVALLVLVPPTAARLLQRQQGPALRSVLALQGGATADVGAAAATATAAAAEASASTMSVGTGWAILFSATFFELISTYYMNAAAGFSRPLPSAIAIVFYAASFYGFNLSLRALEISVAYAVWSAVVMAALAAIGMTVLGESKSLRKVVGIGAITLGTVLLSLEQAP